MPPPTARTKPRTSREDRTAQILQVAALLMLERGLKGMTQADVAERAGMKATNLTHYFRKKEDIAFACLSRTMDHIEARIEQAEREPDAPARVSTFIRLAIEHEKGVREKRVPALAPLSDLRAMSEPGQGLLVARFMTLFNRVKGFFPAVEDATGRALRTARTHVLIEVLLWLPAWILRYSASDYDRVHHRIVEILTHGLSAGSPWAPLQVDARDVGIEDGAARRGFLMAATRLINQRGYHGASVDLIVSEARVTKGSFYHHLEAKDDLVTACFLDSLATISRAQHRTDDMAGTHLQKLQSAVAALLELQLSDGDQLLRTSALQGMPTDVLRAALDRSNRAAGRFADMVIDAMSEGSVRAVDPVVASQMLMAAINGAYELRGWAEKLGRSDAVEIYASTLFDGLFAEATPPGR